MDIDAEAAAVDRLAAQGADACTRALYYSCVELIEQVSPLTGILRLEGDERFDRLLAPLQEARRACWAVHRFADPSEPSR